MADTATIKAGKREELDALAVEQGLDPATFNKVEDLRTELLKSADDADTQAPADDDTAQTAANGEPLNPSEQIDQPPAPANDGETAANAAEAPVDNTIPQGATGHANKFDKNGQPIFTNKRSI